MSVDFSCCEQYRSLYYKLRAYKFYGHYGYINEQKRHHIRMVYCERGRPGRMFMIDFENSNEIGTYIKLTNSYCLVAATENQLINEFLNELNLKIPVTFSEIAGCRIIGRLCVGNKHGLVVTDKITDLELEHLRTNLPDGIKINSVEERLSALGNVVVCNDKVALVHEDIDKETEEIISDTLNVEVFRHRIGNQALVGSYCALNSCGGLVHSKTSTKDIEQLSELLELPIAAGTINKGRDTVGTGLAVNDYCGITGTDSRPHELEDSERIFGYNRPDPPMNFFWGELSKMACAQPEIESEEYEVEEKAQKPLNMSAGAVKLRSWLNKSLRIQMFDGRVLIGIFLCTDRDANVILGSCTEYLPVENSDETIVEEPRMLGLVMVPGKHIQTVAIDQNQDLNTEMAIALTKEINTDDVT